MQQNSAIKLVSNQSITQLPIECYTNPDIYRQEEKLIFPHAPHYLGHALMVPNSGDYHTLSWMADAKMLVNNHGTIELVSNVCRHRQAIMFNGSGNTSHIICPLHRWTYNLKGELIAAPHFNEKPCLNLSHSTLQQWQGMLFDSKRDIGQELKALNCTHDLDFTGYKLNRVMVDEYDFNWKTFIEVYLEDYHVVPFHPGLGRIVDCNQLDWQFGQNWSVQTVAYTQSLTKAGSPVYQRWQQEVAHYHKHETTPPKQGAIWLTYYPFLMVEWYPQTLVVSHLIPRGIDACTNVVEFYYPEDVALFEQQYLQAQQAAYEETAVEDKEICQRMHNGRVALGKQGINEYGPYQHPMETGMQHFHQWYRKQMAPNI